MSEHEGQQKGRRRGNAMVALPLILFASLAIVFGFSLKTSDPSRLPSALIGKAVPKVDFPGIAGLTEAGRAVPGLDAADFGKGEVTVVNFWASWCVPCVQEHPLLVDLAKRGVKVLGVNYKDPAPGGLRFLGRYGNPFAAVGTDGNGRGAIEWGVYGMPETFVVDGKGRIAYKHVGPMTEATLSGQLLPAIEAARKAK